MRGLVGGVLLLAVGTALAIPFVGGAISPQDSTPSDTRAVEQVREQQPAPAAQTLSPSPAKEPAQLAAPVPTAVSPDRADARSS